MSDKIEKKSKDFQPDFGSAVLSLLVGCLMQQTVLEKMAETDDQKELPKIKADEIKTQLEESRNMLTRALKHILPELPDVK